MANKRLAIPFALNKEKIKTTYILDTIYLPSRMAKTKKINKVLKMQSNS